MIKSIALLLILAATLSACGSGNSAQSESTMQQEPVKASSVEVSQYVAAYNSKTVTLTGYFENEHNDVVQFIVSKIATGSEEYKQMLSQYGFNVTVWQAGKPGTEKYFTVYLKNDGLHIDQNQDSAKLNLLF